MIKAANLWRIIRYGMIGAVGTLAQYLILVSAVSAHFATPVAASMAGALVGAIINYILNAKSTFHHTGHGQALPKFAVTAIAGTLINGAILKILIYTGGVHYLVAQVIATVIVLGITYSVNSLWTFRSPTNRSN